MVIIKIKIQDSRQTGNMDTNVYIKFNYNQCILTKPWGIFGNMSTTKTTTRRSTDRTDRIKQKEVNN